MKCATQRCKKEAKEGTFCYSCSKNRYKQKHPVEYAFQTLRNNVNRRNRLRLKQGKPLIPFTITLEEFREFCYETDVLHGRGRLSLSYHIDRIIEELGYAKGNLQKLTNCDNVKKEHRRRKVIAYDHHYKLGFMLNADYSSAPVEDVPF